jgi:predicted regulator of Ras-like GTPase activity (Roadblock/LC7/MglB family)
MSTDEITHLLKDLRSRVEGVKGSMLASTEGLAISSDLSEDMYEMHISAMSAIISGLSGRLLDETNFGSCDGSVIQGSEGKIVVMESGSNCVLAVFMDNDSPLGLAIGEMRMTVKKISAII